MLVHRSFVFAELALACLKFPNLTQAQIPELKFCPRELALMALLLSVLCLVSLLLLACLAAVLLPLALPLAAAVLFPVALLPQAVAVLPVAVAAAVVQAAHL
jgi:hypothetical protein